MKLPERFSNLPASAFPRLRTLLDSHPAGGDVVHMTIGEPKHAFPAWITDVIAEHAAGFNNYPPNEGIPELRRAFCDWLGRRYGVEKDPDVHVMPLNGTREGLYNAAMALPRELGLVGELRVRDVSLLWRAIIALTIGYSAFIAEVFRAGILAVDKGQIEAAKALGLSGYQRFRLVVLPQAIRIILPPLGNDCVAMVKDSSLVSVLGVADITQMAKVYAAGSFRFFETYNIVAYTYLVMVIGLSLALRALERRLGRGR